MDDDFDFTDYIDILNDDVSQTGTDPTTGGGTGGGFDLSSILNTLGGGVKDVGGFLKTFLNPKGDLGGLPLLALAALGNRSGFFNAPVTKVGFQGTIPKYTFERQQTPFAQQRPTMTGPDGKTIPYRPGQGGITYFTPGRFVPYVPPASGGTTGGTTPNTSGGTTDGATKPSGGTTGDYVPTSLIPETPEMLSGGRTIDLPIRVAAGGYMPGGIAMFAGGGRMVGGLEMLAKGRYLKGSGDGVSDSIPAEFAGSGQKAMLADGEFVIPARVVSEIGNGSSDAGARKLYAMLDRIEAQAKKAKRGKPSGADRELNKLA